MTANKTTISVEPDVKAQLAAQKPESQTWSEFMRDLAESGVDNYETDDEVLDELRDVKREIEKLPSRTAESVRTELR